LDAFLYDAMRHVRAAGYVIVDAKRVHDFHIQTAINDAQLIYENADTRAMVQGEIIHHLAADLTKHPDILSWRYSQDSSVGQVLINATLLTIEPRWKIGEPKP
jgi:hypothetical protein